MKLTQSKLGWKQWSTLLCTVAILGVAGCADRNDNGVPESAPTAGEVDRATDAAGNAVAGAAEGAADVGTNATITAKIKTALGANPSVSALAINVDTTEDNKTVTLTGTVKNAAQKNLATNIAKQNAPGYKVVNNLKTEGGASPTMNKKAG